MTYLAWHGQVAMDDRGSTGNRRLNVRIIIRGVQRLKQFELSRPLTCKARILSSLAVSLMLAGVFRGRAADAPAPTSSPPPFKQLRYDESYAYLRDPSQRLDYLDAIKFVPLNTNGDWYLTLGGEIRERYEYYHNSLWGRGPQDDNGYLLQRYMVNADAHLGDFFRVFTQFKSGLEDGRNGGPRPTDRDDFDLNQAFFDVRVPWSRAD